MNILMIGCGKMGGALLEQWRKGPERFTIVDPGLEAAPEDITLVEEREQLDDLQFDALVVAIKPQLIQDVIPGYEAHLKEDGFVLSIAAGTSIARLKTVTRGAPVVRVMPNLPAGIGRGVSGLCHSPDASEAHIALAREMMQRAGLVIDVKDEDQLDRFTAIAGSGPGYIFEMARAFTDAAQELGFTQAQALAMVLGTFDGAIAMARSSEDSLETLRNNVTSKGGTTAAGLNALNGNGQLSDLMRDMVHAAYERAKELR